MGTYSSLCLLMDSNRSFWVLISPNASLRILKGPYVSLNSLCVLKASDGYLWVLIGLYASLRIRMDLSVSLQVLMRPCGL